MSEFLDGAGEVYLSVKNMCLQAVGGGVAILFFLVILLSFPFFLKVQFNPDYENFWVDLQSLPASQSVVDSIRFEEKYNISLGTLELLGSLTPCKEASHYLMAAGDYSIIPLSLFIFPFIFPFFLYYVPRLFGLQRGVFHHGFKPWLISFVVVLPFVLGETLWAFPPLLEGKMGRGMYFICTLILAYTGGYLFFVLRYFIDGAFLSRGLEPNDTFWDDGIILAFTIPVFLLLGNSLGDIGLEVMVGMLPFLIMKFSGFKHDTSSYQDTRSEFARDIEGAADFLVVLALVGFIWVLGPPLWQGTQPVIPFEKLNGEIWGHYEKEEKEKISLQALEFLAKSKEKHHLDTLAAVYAWKGKEKVAKKYASQGVDQTPIRVNLLLHGHSPSVTEKMIKDFDSIRKKIKKAYLSGDKKRFPNRDFQILSYSNLYKDRKLQARIYAWMGKESKALSTAADSRVYTRIKIKKLLAGRAPSLVEKEVKGLREKPPGPYPDLFKKCLLSSWDMVRERDLKALGEKKNAFPYLSMGLGLKEKDGSDDKFLVLSQVALLKSYPTDYLYMLYDRRRRIMKSLSNRQARKIRRWEVINFRLWQEFWQGGKNFNEQWVEELASSPVWRHKLVLACVYSQFALEAKEESKKRQWTQKAIQLAGEYRKKGKERETFIEKKGFSSRAVNIHPWRIELLGQGRSPREVETLVEINLRLMIRFGPGGEKFSPLLEKLPLGRDYSKVKSKISNLSNEKEIGHYLQKLSKGEIRKRE